MARSKKKPVSRSRVAALLVIVVLVAAAGAGIVRIYGSRLPELRSKSQALEAQIQQTEKQNDALRSDLEHRGIRTSSRVWPGMIWAWPPTASAFFTT